MAVAIVAFLIRTSHSPFRNSSSPHPDLLPVGEGTLTRCAVPKTQGHSFKSRDADAHRALPASRFIPLPFSLPPFVHLRVTLCLRMSRSRVTAARSGKGGKNHDTQRARAAS